MKTLLLTALLCALPGGDREAGLAHYAAGRYAEAAAAFRRALEREGDSAELQYNFALASWRAGDLAAAETAVEKYAALAADARADLHAGLLGAVRYDEAKALEREADQALGAAGAQAQGAPAQGAATQPPDPLPLLEQALEKAEQAKDHFVRGATRAASSELLRNTERALAYIEALERKIEELKKQREEQQGDQQDQQQKPDQPPPEDEEQKPDQQPKEQEQQQGEQGQQPEGKPKPDPQQPEPQQGAEQPPEPQPQQPEQQQQPQQQPQQGNEEQQGERPEPQPGEQQQQEQQAQPRQDAPGEGAEGRELSPEQAQRLLEQLAELDRQLQQLRARARSGRRPVERDW